MRSSICLHSRKEGLFILIGTYEPRKVYERRTFETKTVVEYTKSSAKSCSSLKGYVQIILQFLMMKSSALPLGEVTLVTKTNILLF